MIKKDLYEQHITLQHEALGEHGKNVLNGILLDKTGAYFVQFEDTLENLYELLGVDCIDIISRYVDGKRYDFIIDDEGRLKDPRYWSAVADDCEEDIVGPLIIVGEGDEHGDLTELRGGDYYRICRFIGPSLAHDSAPYVLVYHVFKN